MVFTRDRRWGCSMKEGVTSGIRVRTLVPEQLMGGGIYRPQSLTT